MKKRRQNSGSSAEAQAVVGVRSSGQFRLQWLIAILIFSSASLFIGSRLSRPGANVDTRHQLPAQEFATLEQLLATPSSVASIDFLQLNLLAAEGLVGSDQLKISELRSVTDKWTERVKSETARHLYRFRQNPGEYRNSEAYFQALMLVTVLQQDCKVRYNSARAKEPECRNSKDLFLHGVIDPSIGGTCASMPVLYVAIGRQLGYPLKLVPAKAHLFCRWDDGRERFNIEATNQGMETPDDEYYLRWPLKMSESESKYYLRNMSPQEEFAAFLALRADCLEANGRLHEAQIAYAHAHRLAPAFPPYLHALAGVVAKELPPNLEWTRGSAAPTLNQSRFLDDSFVPTPQLKAEARSAKDFWPIAQPSRTGRTGSVNNRANAQGKVNNQ